MAGPWICLIVNSLFHNGDKKVLAGELCRVFGDDLEEVRIVCDDQMEASGEYYTFVKCSDYHKHLDEVIASYAIVNTVLTYENPSFLSDAEVEEFVTSVTLTEVPRIFCMGDIVKVTEGEMAGLEGIVLEPSQNKCIVLFRLFTRKFTKKIFVTSLVYVDNVFSHIKFPVTEERLTCKRLPRRGIYSKAREALIASRRKVHRKAHRKCSKKG